MRCNPRVWDLERYWRDTAGDPIRSWMVGDNYRSGLMRNGDRILLWVGGQSKAYPRGIWGDGLVIGAAGSDLSSSEAVSPYWRHAAMMNAPRVFCPVRITPLLNSAVTDETLRRRGVDDLEVQRLPQGVSPSWVTRDQLARIEKIMRDQPEPAAALSGVGGGQYAPPTENQKVERAAMQAVTDFYERGGWTVDDVSMAKVGWDLTCSRRGQVCRVEVKGVRSERPIVFLTANELRAADEIDDWYLAIVTRALVEPKVTEYSAEAAIAAALPYAFRANLQLDL